VAARCGDVTAARLGLATLSSLPETVRPHIDPRGLEIGIVHLGVGAFHRAHQAVYTEDVIAAAGGGWGICGVTERSAAVVDQLAPQDGLYTLAQRGARGEQLRVIASIRELRWAAADADGVLARIAAPTTRVVTLTVSEKGYRYDPATNHLRLDDPEIAADLADGGARTVVGQLARGLDRRRRGSGAPITVVCCDNIPDNGRVVSTLVRDFAARLPDSEPLLAWLADSVRFPSTMVDRITPATTDADRAALAAALGVTDRGLVVTEPFSQWVIKDDFAAPRPAWERAGATLTADVRPYERIKIRMLNGSHSTLAYLGALAGYELISDAVAPAAPFLAVLRGLLTDDVAPTLAVPDGFDLTGYEAQVLERFANPALRHRTLQVAMDGSQKLPQRLLDTIRDRRAAGAEPALAALGVAAWMRFVSARRTDAGRPLSVDDPLAGAIAARLDGHEGPGAVVDALLSMTAIFGEDLGADRVLRELLVDHLGALARDGAETTARRLTG
jgi:fructuronate reductase